jgi:hypothetical protein
MHNLSVALCECEIRLSNLREKRGLEIRVFENGVLKNTFGLKGEKVTRRGENYIRKSFVICMSQMLGTNQRGLYLRKLFNVCGRSDMHVEF